MSSHHELCSNYCLFFFSFTPIKFAYFTFILPIFLFNVPIFFFYNYFQGQRQSLHRKKRGSYTSNYRLETL